MEKNAFPHAMLFIVGCVVVRTDKTEYMVMQVRGWGQELVILLPGKIIQMQYSATYLFLLKVQKIGRHFVLTDGTNYYIGGY